MITPFPCLKCPNFVSLSTVPRTSGKPGVLISLPCYPQNAFPVRLGRGLVVGTPVTSVAGPCAVLPCYGGPRCSLQLVFRATDDPILQRMHLLQRPLMYMSWLAPPSCPNTVGRQHPRQLLPSTVAAAAYLVLGDRSATVEDEE